MVAGGVRVGNAKTETVAALAGAGAQVTSTITSEGALLSATSRKDAAKDADRRAAPQARRPRRVGGEGLHLHPVHEPGHPGVGARRAAREYDGRWERNVGTDGGRTLTWTGRLVVVGAVTTAYDQAHAVIASMGDRFALVRVDSNVGRLDAGRQALRNVGHEVAMRASWRKPRATCSTAWIRPGPYSPRTSWAPCSPPPMS